MVVGVREPAREEWKGGGWGRKGNTDKWSTKKTLRARKARRTDEWTTGKGHGHQDKRLMDGQETREKGARRER